MSNAILIHGCCSKEEYFNDKYPSLTNSHWFPWLQKQLLINEVFTQTPEMPSAYDPSYDDWKKEFERFDIDKDTYLVGHSCGGGFLLHYLSENKISAKKLILVAPSLHSKRASGGEFLEFDMDSDITNRMEEVHVLLSDDEDVEGITQSVDEIIEVMPSAKLHKFSGMGHFTFGDMKTSEFPELRDIILG